MVSVGPGRRGRPAGIAYHGVAGVSQDCLDAVLNLLMGRSAIRQVRLLSAVGSHALLLSTEFDDLIAIKSGFTSGYSGEGPTALSRALCALVAHGATISEHAVEPDYISRIDDAALTLGDLETLSLAQEIRPARWADYIQERHHRWVTEGYWVAMMPAVMPFAILDRRLAASALRFWANPDQALVDGYRLLEDTVRRRSGLDRHGARLFREAFNSRLGWPVAHEAEREGRAQLFANAFMAFRNPRMHRPAGADPAALAEFLLLNQLFRLEAEAVETAAVADLGPA
ncbi:MULTISPECIES: TIGR02391 family protein [unclassified Brevundimonas]|uniref:TIGR02391 family protein n=1 Tax=unclassified Brevundimonas TaxID=2622653 RepID=UPI0025C19F38|nr:MULTISPECIES: TIGR02391 family protein [unclassified Brevundimonas]